MLTGIKIFSSDCIWRQILSDLNATVLDAPSQMAVNLDDVDIDGPISPTELKARILGAGDVSDIIVRVFGNMVSLPRTQLNIVVALHKNKAMSANELKVALGYAPDATTHAVDTAIYQLRKTFGHDFIINKNGVYTLGRL